MSRTVVEELLKRNIPDELLMRLLNNYEAAHKNFRLGKIDDGLVAAGRFSEMIFSLLHYRITGKIEYCVDGSTLYDPLKKSKLSESEKEHMYRVARDIYSLRSRKTSAHETEFDPTVLDSIYIQTCMNWIVAELIRIYSGSSAVESKKLAESLMKKNIPLLEEIDGYPVVLSTDINSSLHMHLILYWKYPEFLSASDIIKFSQGHFTKSQIYYALNSAQKSRTIFKNPDTGLYKLSEAGINYVEGNIQKFGE